MDLSRWIYSTDARDIGILYLILSGFSGMVGSAMSLFIRLQLMDINQNAILNMPSQVYNSIITVHALLMIFYLVMPAMFGGFGKIIPLNISFNFLQKKRFSKNPKNPFFGHYLAGLIEGDGSITVRQSSKNKKRYHPKITLIFNKNDLPLAEHLKNLLQCGSIMKKSGYVVWQIQDLEGVKKIFDLINGKMRTPKIEALHRGINYLKDLNYLDPNYPLLPLDTSPIEANSWLAGFTDADGNFSINLSQKKAGYRISLYYRLELRQNYPKEVLDHLGGNSYFNILSKVSTYFKVNLYSRTRTTNYGLSQSFIVMAYSKDSLKLVVKYFNEYPLFSSRYLNYLDFLKIIELKEKNPLTKDYLEEVLKIKNNFNKNRIFFNWDHLKNLKVEN
jgi:hypothetical protein